jgi:acyl dehydratase
MKEVAYADIAGLVGEEIGVSDWVEVSQERVNQFAEATGDHQWIHVDVERATKRIRMRQKLVSVEPKAGGLQMKNECTIEIEGEERPACVAETISVIYGA